MTLTWYACCLIGLASLTSMSCRRTVVRDKTSLKRQGKRPTKLRISHCCSNDRCCNWDWNLHWSHEWQHSGHTDTSLWTVLQTGTVLQRSLYDAALMGLTNVVQHISLWGGVWRQEVLVQGFYHALWRVAENELRGTKTKWVLDSLTGSKQYKLDSLIPIFFLKTILPEHGLQSLVPPL